MSLFSTYKPYFLYFPVGMGNQSAASELASGTGIKSLQKQTAQAVVRWIAGQDGLSNWKRDSCELNDQSRIGIWTHAMGKKDSREYWKSRSTPQGVINALLRHHMDEFRVRSTTGNISIYFGRPGSHGGTSSFGLGALAKAFVPAAEGIGQIYSFAEGARSGLSTGGQILNAMTEIVFYMEALQGIDARLSISCPAEGVTCQEIANHLIKLHKFPPQKIDASQDYKD